MQYLILEKNKSKTLVVNIHGYWNPDTKSDTPQSWDQMNKIIKFLNSNKYEKIFCGDFNLNPNTKSMKLLERDMVNLIKKNNIKSTRSNHHKRKDKLADYILVSKKVNVINFKVLQEYVSDHLPLFLEFEND